MPQTAIEAVTSTIEGYSAGSAVKPTLYQCFKLLHADFPQATYWFSQVFPNFVGPEGATADELMSIKAVLYSWVLHFGPVAMQESDWTDLKTAMSAPSASWTSYLGWLGSAPKFTVNGNTELEYPAALKVWLSRADGCHAVTVGCPDLEVFNLKSIVCDTTPCSVAAGCTEAKAGSTCAP